MRQMLHRKMDEALDRTAEVGGGLVALAIISPAIVGFLTIGVLYFAAGAIGGRHSEELDEYGG